MPTGPALEPPDVPDRPHTRRDMSGQHGTAPLGEREELRTGVGRSVVKAVSA